MNKNLKLSFILFTIASAVIIAWRTLANFFNGVGLNFVTLLIVVAVSLSLILTNKYVYNRIKDLFFTLCGLAILETIMYFAVEFSFNLKNTCVGLIVYQSIISSLGILYFCYTIFRFITEIKEVKIGFIEFILGNGKPTKQQKKAKELTNGTLEEKPNNKKEEPSQPVEEEIVSTEEE